MARAIPSDFLQAFRFSVDIGNVKNLGLTSVIENEKEKTLTLEKGQALGQPLFCEYIPTMGTISVKILSRDVALSNVVPNVPITAPIIINPFRENVRYRELIFKYKGVKWKNALNLNATDTQILMDRIVLLNVQCVNIRDVEATPQESNPTSN